MKIGTRVRCAVERIEGSEHSIYHGDAGVVMPGEAAPHGDFRVAFDRAPEPFVGCGPWFVKESEVEVLENLYIAGPMTGLPQFNFPAFDAAAVELRQRGYEVTSPAELDSPESRAAALASPDGDPEAYENATDETWGDLLARDVKLIADRVHGVVVLPGWERSRGARLETFVARLCGKPIYRYNNSGESFERLADREVAAVHDFPLETRVAVGVDLGHVESGAATHDDATGEVRTVNATTGGEKGTKPQRFDLLPWGSLSAVSEVYHFGASKYADRNWEKGYDYSLSFGALHRHVAAWWGGQEHDPESGLSHLAHAAFHVLGLLHFSQHGRYAALDNRPVYTGDLRAEEEAMVRALSRGLVQAKEAVVDPELMSRLARAGAGSQG